MSGDRWADLRAWLADLTGPRPGDGTPAPPTPTDTASATSCSTVVDSDGEHKIAVWVEAEPVFYSRDVTDGR